MHIMQISILFNICTPFNVLLPKFCTAKELFCILLKFIITNAAYISHSKKAVNQFNRVCRVAFRYQKWVSTTTKTCFTQFRSTSIGEVIWELHLLETVSLLTMYEMNTKTCKYSFRILSVQVCFFSAMFILFEITIVSWLC